MTAVVIGYGNVLRGDDEAGPRAAEAVAELALPGVRCVAVAQLVPELAELLAGASMAVFIDAWLGPPDMGVRVEDVAVEVQSDALGHVRSPGALMALAEAVYGRRPPAWVVQVPAVSFEVGDALSDTTVRGIAEATEVVARLVTANGHPSRREGYP
jgi:hydrogenase maturation protease